MKRTTLIIVLLAVLVVSCLALTACHEHEFGEWEVIKQPTCTKDGSKERVCECGEKETEVVPATGHTFGAHIVIKQTTCTEDGADLGTCECGKTELIVVKALGHDEIKHAAQSVTCTGIGWDEYVTCSRCNYSTYKEIPPQGHKYVNKVCRACGDLEGSYGLFLSEYDTCYVVSGIGTCTDADVVIPSIYNGKPVTGIDFAAFRDCTSLTSITIPSSVTSIGTWSFYNCYNLTNITIPSSVTIIFSQAFRGCTSLTNITIPDSVTSIGEGVFMGCTSLTSITIPSSVTSIGDSAFYGCLSLENITIPPNVRIIGKSAFYGCSSLKNITIPSSVINIGVKAFYECISLSSVTFGSPNDWYVYGHDEIALSLTDPSTNAELLKSTYCNYHWYKYSLTNN